MTRSKSRWIPLITLAFSAPLVACGGSSTGTTPSAVASAPLATAPTPAASTAAAQCPTGASVGSALGITVPNAVGVAGGGSTPFPAPATGIVCDYHGAGDNVIIEVLMNISPSFISNFTAHFTGSVKTVSGVGDNASSFFQSLGGGKDNEGVVATKGSTLVSIVATATPASLSQVEALVSSLL